MWNCSLNRLLGSNPGFEVKVFSLVWCLLRFIRLQKGYVPAEMNSVKPKIIFLKLIMFPSILPSVLFPACGGASATRWKPYVSDNETKRFAICL